jgi:capsular exopolysaccharide synthesis family protein
MNDLTSLPKVAPSSGAQADNPASALSGLDLNDLARVVVERRFIILGAALLGILAGIALSLLATPLFRGTALLELNPPSAQVIDSASGQDRQSSYIDPQELVATNLGLVRSESLARRVAQELNLVSKPEFGGSEGSRQERLNRAAAVVQANTQADGVRESTLLKVSYISPDPQLAARVSNALADGFIASTLERRYESSSYARDFLRDQIASTREALENSERALNAYALSTGIVRTPERVANGVSVEGSSLTALDLESLNSAVNEARVRRVNAEQAYRNGAGGASASANSASSATLREQRALLRSQYEEKSRIFKEDYPEMIELSARIAALDREISAARTAGSGIQRGELLAEYRAAKDAEDQLASNYARLKTQVQKESGTSIQYNILKREVEQNRQIYDALLQRFKEIGVAGGIGQANVSIVDRAPVPQAPFSPDIPFNATMGLLIGLGLGLAVAVLAHLMLDNVLTPSDVRTKLGLPVLGVIPEVEDGLPLVDAIEDRKSNVSEAYYALRSALQFLADGGMPRSILLTSTSPGEGKSTSAFALASNFARSGRRTLLIDADLRKPTFRSGGKDGRGLATLLTTTESLESTVEETIVDGLYLLPVGRFSNAAAELLTSPRLGQVLREAHDAYDVVLIDGPPVLGFADAPLLGALADKTILIIQAGAARTTNVNEMIRRLRSSGTELAGVVLTKVRGGIGYGYNYYSYSYGGDMGGKVTSDVSRAIDIGRNSSAT